MAVGGVNVNSILQYVSSMVSASKTAEGDTGLAAVIKTPSNRKIITNVSGAFGGEDQLSGKLGDSGRIIFRQKISWPIIAGSIFLIWIILKKGK